MDRCLKCKHWELKDAYSDGRWGYCKLARMRQALPSDGERFIAGGVMSGIRDCDLHTREDFGCVDFKGKPTGPFRIMQSSGYYAVSVGKKIGPPLSEKDDARALCNWLNRIWAQKETTECKCDPEKHCRYCANLGSDCIFLWSATSLEHPYCERFERNQNEQT